MIPQITSVKVNQTGVIKVTRTIVIEGIQRLEIPFTNVNSTSFRVKDDAEMKEPSVSGLKSFDSDSVMKFDQPILFEFKDLEKKPIIGNRIPFTSNPPGDICIQTDQGITVVSLSSIFSYTYIKNDKLENPTSSYITLYGKGKREVKIIYNVNGVIPTIQPRVIDKLIKKKVVYNDQVVGESDIKEYPFTLSSFITWECFESIDHPVKLVFKTTDSEYVVEGFTGVKGEITKNEVVRLKGMARQVSKFTNHRNDGEMFIYENTSGKVIPYGGLSSPNTKSAGFHSIIQSCGVNEYGFIPLTMLSNRNGHSSFIHAKATSSVNPIRVKSIQYSIKSSKLVLETVATTEIKFNNMTDYDHLIALTLDQNASLSALGNDYSLVPSSKISLIDDQSNNNNNSSIKRLDPTKHFYLLDIGSYQSTTIKFKDERKGSKTITIPINLNQFDFMSRVFQSVNQPNRDEYEITNIQVQKEDQDILFEYFRHFYGWKQATTGFGGNQQPNVAFGTNQQATTGFGFGNQQNVNAFGANQQGGFGSTFGAPAAPVQQQSAGLFGQAQTQQSAGLFGQAQTQQSQSGSLFGGPAAAPVQQQSAGLFGQAQTQQSQGFGSSFGTSSSTSSFGFGSPPPAPASPTPQTTSSSTATSAPTFGAPAAASTNSNAVPITFSRPFSIKPSSTTVTQESSGPEQQTSFPPPPPPSSSSSGN